MRKVKMRTLRAGPGGIDPPGSILELEDREAAELLAGNFAEPVQTEEVETATAEPAEETATAPKPAKKKAGKKRAKRVKRTK